MTLNQILNTVKGIPYVNNVIDDWDAKDHSWGVTKKVIEYAKYLKNNPQSVANLPPLVVIDGNLNDGAHRLSAINLLQQRMDPTNPYWKKVPLKVNFGTSADVVPKQGGGMTPRAISVPPTFPANTNARGGGVGLMNPDPLAQLMREENVEENFADGRNPQDKGDAKRHGINTRASVSSLRKTAKSGGRKGQLAHWLANMKAGRAKAKRKTNEAVDPQTVAAFTARVQDALAKIAQNTDPRYPDQKEFVKLIAANKVKIMNGNPSNPAFSLGHDLNMDAEEFHDAPESVLILVMAHEIGHIIYGHTFRDPKAPPLTVAQEQQEEYAADQFAINIMKRLGIQKVPVWTWLRRKKNDLEQFKQDQDAAPPGSWPTFNQRSDQAQKLGVELTKINTDQIDQALQHMA